MKFFKVEPEVAGGLGAKTVMDNSIHPPIVHKLHYEFDGWLGDDLLETFPCYIVSERLKRKIKEEKLGGNNFDEILISKSEQFKDIYPNRELPIFYRLKVDGSAGEDDFGISKDHKLVVSEKALIVLKKFNLNNCEIEEYKCD